MLASIIGTLNAEVIAKYEIEKCKKNPKPRIMNSLEQKIHCL